MGAKTERRHQQGDETRRRILDATIEIAAERGYEGTTMSQIADRAGVSMSSIYWHFSDKDAVMAAVIRRSYDEWLGDVVTWSRPDGGTTATRDEMIAAIRGDIVALTRHPEFLRLGLMLSLERRPAEPTARAIFLEVRRDSLELLEAAFARLIEAHGSGADDPGLAHRLAVLVMAAADGLFVAHTVTPSDIEFEEAIDLLIGGVVDRACGPAVPPGARS